MLRELTQLRYMPSPTPVEEFALYFGARCKTLGVSFEIGFDWNELCFVPKPEREGFLRNNVCPKVELHKCAKGYFLRDLRSANREGQLLMKHTAAPLS